MRKITERQNGTRKNERLYTEGLEIFREYDGSGDSVTLERETLCVMDDKQNLALVETRTQGNDGSPQRLIRYQFGDHLASSSLELDDTGQIISYEEFYPYGNTSYQAGRSLAEVRLKRYRYTGQERDDESGFYYKEARYYPPWLGRWINADPTGLTGGPNLYCHAFNSPILFKDVTGDIPDKCFVHFDNGDRLYSPTRCGPLSKWKKKRPGKKGGKKGSTAGTDAGVPGGEDGGVPGGVVGGTGDVVGAKKKEKPGGGDGPGSTPGTGDQPEPNQQPKSDESASTGPGDSTKKTQSEGKAEGEESDQGGGTETDKEPGGKPGGSKKGTPQGTQTVETEPEGTETEKGKGGAESSVLADLSALASLVSDPESLYNAQQSGNKGSGSQSGSSFGFITGWLAQVLTIVTVFGGAIKKLFSAIGGAIKKGLSSVKNKLFGSAEKKLLAEEAESLTKGAAKKFTEGEEAVIESYMNAGKTRAEAEKAVLEFRGETVEALTPNSSPNAAGTTRKRNNPGPGKKRP